MSDRRARQRDRSWLASKSWRALAVVLIAGGTTAIAVAVTSQYDTPTPSSTAFGTTGRAGPTASTHAAARSHGAHPSPVPGTTAGTMPPSLAPPGTTGPILGPSVPIAIAIPAINVQSSLQIVGLNPDGTIAVPQPGPDYNDAAWYEYSPTPGQLGPAVIEGHIDSAADGPSVFFKLGALVPGDQVDVSRADGTVAVFTVSGVRQYPKDAFPTMTVYGNTTFAALRLITCGGSFDHNSGHYVDNTVVFASLTSSYPAS